MRKMLLAATVALTLSAPATAKEFGMNCAVTLHNHHFTWVFSIVPSQGLYTLRDGTTHARIRTRMRMGVRRSVVDGKPSMMLFDFARPMAGFMGAAIQVQSGALLMTNMIGQIDANFMGKPISYGTCKVCPSEGL